MCLAQGPQRSDAGEARTRGPSVSSQALVHSIGILTHNGIYRTYQLDESISNVRVVG